MDWIQSVPSAWRSIYIWSRRWVDGTVDTLVGRCSKSLSVALILHKTLSEWE